MTHLLRGGVRTWGSILLLALPTALAIGATSCGGGGGIVCKADSICQPACAADPDCAGPGQGGQSGSGPGAGGSGGTTGGGGIAAGTGGGAAGSAGTTGAGGSGGASCGAATVTGQVSFTGVSDVAFNVITPTVQHKRDIDQFEDGCFNLLEFSFGFAAGCTLRVVARDCLDAQGRMKVQSVNFMADSQCPNFPDTVEGSYTGSAAAVDGSWVQMSVPRISERNVATSCTSAQFQVILTGTLTAGTRTLTIGPSSMLTVSGQFVSNARDAVCPGMCTGAGGTTGRGGAGGTGGAAGRGGSGGTGGAAGRGGAGGTGGVAGPCQPSNLYIEDVAPTSTHDHLPLAASGASSAAQLAAQINSGTPLTFTVPTELSHTHTLTFTSTHYTTLRGGGAVTLPGAGTDHVHAFEIECLP